jgi:hypothetical protein
VIQEYEVINSDIEREICQFEDMELIGKGRYGMVDSKVATGLNLNLTTNQIIT